MKAADLMTTNVVTVRTDSPVAEAVRLMIEHRVSGLPVLDGRGQLAGIVTEGDLLRRGETGTEVERPRWLEFVLGTARLADDYVRSHARQVEDTMSREVEVASPDMPLADVVALMERRHVKRLPVLRDGRLVGIITRADLVRALHAALQRAAAPARSDDAIRASVIAEIGRQPWAPEIGPSVVVRDGVVHLCGVITTEELRRALRIVAENTQGVRTVKDHLTLVEPMSGTYIDPPDGPLPAATTKTPAVWP